MVSTAFIVLVATFLAHYIAEDYEFKTFSLFLLGTVGFLTVMLIIALYIFNE